MVDRPDPIALAMILHLPPLDSKKRRVRTRRRPGPRACDRHSVCTRSALDGCGDNDAGAAHETLEEIQKFG